MIMKNIMKVTNPTTMAMMNIILTMGMVTITMPITTITHMTTVTIRITTITDTDTDMMNIMTNTITVLLVPLQLHLLWSFPP